VPDHWDVLTEQFKTLQPAQKEYCSREQASRIETLDERGKLLETYRARRRELHSCRLDIPRQVSPMSGHDHADHQRVLLGDRSGG
jgi:hypothetical protein